MSMKMKIPSIFLKNKQQWQWPSCKHPKTLSFRETTNDIDSVFKTVNSVFLDTSDVSLEAPESYRFTNSSFEYATSTTATTILSDDNNSTLETIVQSVRLSNSERLFFEPGYMSSSIMKEEVSVIMKNNESQANISIDHDEMSSSVAVVAVESDNPYLDFKKSMAEMVESHGLIKDWDCLEELLGWYLKMNSNNNHAFIVAAFLDLLLANSSTSSSSSMGVCCSDSVSYSSAESSFSYHSS